MASCEIITLRNKPEWKQQNEYMYVQLLSIKKNDIKHFLQYLTCKTIPCSEKKIIFIINTSKSQKLPELESKCWPSSRSEKENTKRELVWDILAPFPDTLTFTSGSLSTEFLS